MDYFGTSKPTSSSQTKQESSCPRLIESSDKRVQRLLDRLLQEKSILDRLPSTSCYVVHRLKVIKRAMEILSPSDNTGAAHNIAELDQLLALLSLS